MSSANNAPAGPSMFKGAQNFGINEIHSVVAGRDAHRNAPVFNFNAPVHMADPSFGPISGIPIPRDSRETLAPQRLGIVNGLSRLLNWLQALTIQDPSSQVTSSAMESEDSGTEDSQMANSTPATSSKESISLSLLQDIENRSVDWQRLRTPEVYVFRMLNIMRGLPCWQPDPQGLAGPQGIIPGDVGTYSVGEGFLKMWNIWDDEETVRRTSVATPNSKIYFAPQGRQTLRTQAFAEGDTVAEGPSAATIFRPGTDTIERFEFGCQAQGQGALLAFTSPADREWLYDRTALRQHIIQYAELIYTHSNDLRRIGDDEALYIITGSTKSNNWGLAAFSNPMFRPNDTIRLEHLSRGVSTQSGKEAMFYAWTQKGTAEARVGSSPYEGVWDQSLFLEGFKLDFSPEFRARKRHELDSMSRGRDGEGGVDGNFGAPGGRGGELPGEPPAPSGQGGNAGGGGGPSNFRSQEGMDLDDLHVQMFSDSSRGTSCHPCDIINEALFELISSPFALCHDDDWLSAMEENSGLNPQTAIYIQNGVAFLGNVDNPPRIGDDPGIRPIDVPTLIAEKGYNPQTFNVNPGFARYFVIKSYTEADVHKSLKHEIWCSSESGNKRLDKAFKDTSGRGPVYLFFSVNGSGHFCGVAEMLTSVDYTKSSTVWDSDKWKGVFKVRWIFVKDIAFSKLSHIKLNNTEKRKPVTNSRDTQELLPAAGQEMLQIFYGHHDQTSLLQNYVFFEMEAMQSQKADPAPPVPIQVMTRNSSLSTTGSFQSGAMEEEEGEEEELLQAFNIFAKDDTGTLGEVELREVMRSLGELLSEEEAKQMIEEADGDGDGEIDFDEFKKMMGH